MSIQKFKHKYLDISKYVRVFESNESDDPDALALNINPTLSKTDIKDMILNITDDLGAAEDKLNFRVFLCSGDNNTLEVTNKNSINLTGSGAERVTKWLSENKGCFLKYDISYGSNYTYHNGRILKCMYGDEAPDYLNGFIKDTDSVARMFKEFNSVKKKFRAIGMDIDISFNTHLVEFIIIDSNVDTSGDFGLTDETKEVRELADKINTEILVPSTRYSNYKVGYAYSTKQLYVGYIGSRSVSKNFKSSMITWIGNQLRSKIKDYSFEVIDLTTLVTNNNGDRGYDRWMMNSALNNNQEYKDIVTGYNSSFGTAYVTILAKLNYGPPVAMAPAIKKKRVPRKPKTT